MIELKRGSTWDFLAYIKVNNVFEDLRGAKIYLTLKTEFTDPVTDPIDASAILKLDYTIPNGTDRIEQYAISVDYSDSKTVAPGMYIISIQYKLASGKVHEPITEICAVSADGTNRTV
jgi:hypothetical protein